MCTALGFNYFPTGSCATFVVSISKRVGVLFRCR